MSYTTLLLTREPPVTTVRLNRPHRMNAVVEEMYIEIQDALEGLAVDPQTRCLVLTGSVLVRDGVTKQAFCAGADLKEHAAGKRSAAARREYIELAHATTRRLFEFPKPSVAAINGPARGAGTELALNCDFIVISEDASIALPEIGLGTFVGGGITHILPRLVGLARAKELVYTGRTLSGVEAHEAGLALRCCPAADLEHAARTLALELASGAPLSLRLAKKLLNEALDVDLHRALAAETEAILDCMQTADWSEGVTAFVERRRPKFEDR